MTPGSPISYWWRWSHDYYRNSSHGMCNICNGRCMTEKVDGGIHKYSVCIKFRRIHAGQMTRMEVT